MLQKSRKGKSAARKPPGGATNIGERRPTCGRKEPPAVPGLGRDEAIGRLLSARSELAGIVSEIDRLVAHALKHKTVTERGKREIESFSVFVSNIHTSLKPWIPKLEEALKAVPPATENCKDENLAPSKSDILASPANFMVSPSPLVSWRAGSCMADEGKQLFLLTPLPKAHPCSSRRQATSKLTATPGIAKELSMLLTFTNGDRVGVKSVKVKGPLVSMDEEHAFKGKGISENPISSPLGCSYQQNRSSSIFLLTPGMKTSTKALLAPIHEPSEKEISGSVASPIENDRLPDVSDNLSSEILSEHLALRYAELFGMPTSKYTERILDVEKKLDWFLSPPKTCVLMNPSDEKMEQSLAGNGDANTVLVTTPWKVIESTTRKGEATLKRELWTKFDAASKGELHIGSVIFDNKRGEKCFLDRLEEAAS